MYSKQGIWLYLKKLAGNKMLFIVYGIEEV